MAAINLQKLDRIVERFAGVEHALSSGVTGEAFVKNSKDYAELAPMAKGAGLLKAAYLEREGLVEMLAGGGELAQMAEAEKPQLDARMIWRAKRLLPAGYTHGLGLMSRLAHKFA